MLTGTPTTGDGFVITGLLTGGLMLGVITGLAIGNGELIGFAFGTETGVVEGTPRGVDPWFGNPALGFVAGTVTIGGAELSEGTLTGVKG